MAVAWEGTVIRKEQGCPPVTSHVFTVDVEDYFHVNAFEPYVPRVRWEGMSARVSVGIDRLLDLLARHGATATFFVLGWVADRHPHEVRRIVEAGHEVASHGFWHRRVYTLTPEAFRRDLRHAREAIEQASGQAVVGFRAPSFSILRTCEWALDVLIEEGYRYDSSLFPIRRRNYGHRGAATTPGLVERAGGCLLELPPLTTQLMGVRLPAAGGGYFRQFPYWWFRRAFEDATRRRVPGVFYVHPWELDPEQPRLPVGAVTQWRHYRGLDQVGARLERLLSDFRFVSVSSRFPAEVS